MVHIDHLVFLRLPKSGDKPNLLTKKIMPLCSMVKGMIHFGPFNGQLSRQSKYPFIR